MENLESILAEHRFLEGLDPKHLQLLVGCASNVRFNAGEKLFEEGAQADHFYFIRHGKVAIEIFATGRGPITIDTLEDGEVLGWSWLIEPYQWHFDAHAVTLTRAIALDGKCLRTKCEEDHSLGYELLKRFSHVITDRLQMTQLQLLDLYGNPQRT